MIGFKMLKVDSLHQLQVLLDDQFECFAMLYGGKRYGTVTVIENDRVHLTQADGRWGMFRFGTILVKGVYAIKRFGEA